MDNKEKIDFLEKELARLLGWIQGIESRISLVLPLATAMAGTLIALIPQSKIELSMCSISMWVLCLTFLLLFVCVVFIAISSFPRMKGPEKSLIFFGKISAEEKSKYKYSIANLTEDIYIEDLIGQCYINAEIATIKYSWVKKSLLMLFLSSISWVGSLFVIFLLGTG